MIYTIFWEFPDENIMQKYNIKPEENKLSLAYYVNITPKELIKLKNDIKNIGYKSITGKFKLSSEKNSSKGLFIVSIEKFESDLIRLNKRLEEIKIERKY